MFRSQPTLLLWSRHFGLTSCLFEHEWLPHCSLIPPKLWHKLGPRKAFDGQQEIHQNLLVERLYRLPDEKQHAQLRLVCNLQDDRICPWLAHVVPRALGWEQYCSLKSVLAEGELLMFP
jgi:hypothetical protein